MGEDTVTKEFPEGMEPLGKGGFRFACHPGLQCFRTCCRQLDMHLYPYDIIRLKKKLAISSDRFLQQYTRLGPGDNPYFPAVMMRMRDNEGQTCPFLAEHGCSVYDDRPTACRTYPLERAVDRTPVAGRPEEFFFVTRHVYCQGHREERTWTLKEWQRDQRLLDYNAMNDLWAEIDTLFAGNPWQGEGAAGPKQQLAFMVCYNIDGFRKFIQEHDLLRQFRIDKTRLRLIGKDDESLLKFGFDWLQYILAGRPSLIAKR